MRKNVKKQTRGRITLLILSVMMMFAMVGCGKEKDKKEPVTTTSTESTSETTAEGTGEQTGSEFDFSQVFDNIEINGKKVPFPFTLNDLGEGYEFGTPLDMGDGVYSMGLYFNNKDTYIDVYVKEINDKYINENSKIFRLYITSSENQNISINGISIDSTEKEIEEKFSYLPINYDKDNKKMGFLAIKEENVFDIYMENGKIQLITIIYGGVE